MTYIRWSEVCIGDPLFEWVFKAVEARGSFVTLPLLWKDPKLLPSSAFHSTFNYVLAPSVLDELKKVQILELLEQGKRVDGRALDESREIKIETNSSIYKNTNKDLLLL